MKTLSTALRKKTLDWFIDSAARLTGQRRKTEHQRGEADLTVAPLQDRIGPENIGQLVMYAYDPKHKATLPYYDVFPLVFPLEFYSDGWLGINLHYLPPVARAKLMDALYNLVENGENGRTRIAASYEILKGASKFRAFRPCLKRYLTSHARSKFMIVPYDKWDVTLSAPTARFMKESEQRVWNDSLRAIERY